MKKPRRKKKMLRQNKKSHGKAKKLRRNGKSGGKIEKHVLTQSSELYPRIFRNI